MGNEQSGNGQPTASDEKSKGAVSTGDPAEDSADVAEDAAAETEAPESDTATTESPGKGGEAEPPGNESPASGPSGQKPLVLALVAVVALIVGLVVGVVAAGGSDDEADADEAEGESGSEGHEGHGDMAMGDDESGLSQLLEDHHYHAPTDEPIDAEARALLTAQLEPMDEWAKELPTIADAEEADWRRAGPFIPGLGTHYIPRDMDVTFTIRDSLDGDADEGTEVRPLLIYDGLEDDSALAGFMLMAQDDPGDFAGPYDFWHQHTNVCVVNEPGGDIDLPFVGDMESTTEERCESVGGSLTEITSHMVHVWSIPTYESELGLFSEVNPKITCPDGTYHRVPYGDLEPPYTTTCVDE